MIISGNIVDIQNRRIFPGSIELEGEKIVAIREVEGTFSHYIMPGFIDAHIHIESSMLVPSEFARLAVVHGTVATVSDPHEIANVLGVAGVKYMIDNGKEVPFKFNFGAPSCVPATAFETAGACINSDEILELLKDPDVKYLAEMMNYPGVIYDDAEVHQKIKHAQDLGKPVDGHAPGLSGKDLEKYISAGISTDHECFSYEEALEKLRLGMKVIIREGSAAKNFEALVDLLPEHYQNMMFCSDDKHPDDLIEGHINDLVARAVARGIDKFKVLQAATLNPIEHYQLEVGNLMEGALADFIIVEDLKHFKVLSTYINGKLVAKEGRSFIQSVPIDLVNNFETDPKSAEQFRLPHTTDTIHIIEAIDGELVTNHLEVRPKVKGGFIIPDREEDILKIAVVNRYRNEEPAVAMIKGFGLKVGAMASCVGHDSHNIIVVGTDDDFIAAAVNLIIKNKGGISAVAPNVEAVLPLPIAGIMSNSDGVAVGRAYAQIDAMTKDMGSKLRAPFMTLSFMALLVIPSLKLSDLGLFDGIKFEFVDKQR